MKVSWSHLVVPSVGAFASAHFGSVAFWDASKAPLLTMLSVIAAGVLVRLARGMPFTSPDQFELDEIRQIAAAVKQSIRALRALIAVVFLSMLSLVFAKATVEALVELLEIRLPESVFYMEPVISAFVGFLLTYVFVRIFAVIRGDVNLVDLQANLMIKAVERKQLDRFDKKLDEIDAPSMRNPQGYGKIVQ